MASSSRKLSILVMVIAMAVCGSAAKYKYWSYKPTYTSSSGVSYYPAYTDTSGNAQNGE